jgi:exonuclease III
MIDFILCSPAMGGGYVKDSARILHGSVETIGSDHNPVVASFRLR